MGDSVIFSIGESVHAYLCTSSMHKNSLKLVALCKWQKFASAYVYCFVDFYPFKQ